MMAKVYLSSTYTDLVEYREAAYRTLRKMRHDVIAMEDYVATDERPLRKCLEDVGGCDIYVGLFAWRYGYVPEQDNPDKRSVTELEYRKAGEAGIPRLIFLLDTAAPWTPSAMDAVTGGGDGGRRISDLRKEMGQAKLVSFFNTPDQLASLVSVAVQHAAPPTAVSGPISVAQDAEIVRTSISGDIAGVKGNVTRAAPEIDVLKGGKIKSSTIQGDIVGLKRQGDDGEKRP
jgi:hypothetical protein